MPELPEVETVRRTLAARMAGRRVVGVTLHRRDVVCVPGDPEGGFSRARGRAVRPRRVRRADLLLGARVREVRRHGKQLAIIGADGRAVCVHLGMSGQVLHLFRGARGDRRDHVHVTWRLDDGSRVLFRDPRRFGGVWAFPSVEGLLAARWARLGPDGLTVTGRTLGERFGGSTRAVKAALLDQSVVAGVGNIYADEALFEAGVHPETPACGLDGRTLDRLAEAIRSGLERAIEAGGSSIRDYVGTDGQAGRHQLAHAVYGRAGGPCRRCGSALASGMVAQRTTVWCPCCQGPRGSPGSISEVFLPRLVHNRGGTHPRAPEGNPAADRRQQKDSS